MPSDRSTVHFVSSSTLAVNGSHRELSVVKICGSDLWLDCKLSMSVDTITIGETEEAVGSRRKSYTTDGFVVPSGEVDCDLPVQREDPALHK